MSDPSTDDAYQAKSRPEESYGQLDPRKPLFCTFFGKKGCGKSVLAAQLFRSYPFDRIAIDLTQDLGKKNLLGPNTETIHELPSRFPVDDDGEQVSLRYVPDPGDPTYADDMDRAVGLAFYHPGHRCCVLVDEIAELTSASKTGPHMRRALHQGRHQNLTMLMAGPRPVDVNPLTISQSDLVYVFRMPHPLDKERVAATIGWPPKDFAAKVDALGKFEYLRYDSDDQELTHWPPIPMGRR